MKEIFYEDVGGPVTALALNKSTTLVAVAGRSIFKIYNINENEFELNANLRVAKNVGASCNDVAWNQINENILASATSSGAVVTWNLNKSGFSKMDTVYQDHKRTVNKVHFHNNDPYLLLSGSQDSIKVFDLRQNEAVINYSGLNESVRDLQFSPHKANVFIAVQDNGYVLLFDVRKKDRFEQCFPGHNGPILACDWHPEQADIVATAGRDMSIKVWNVAGQTPSMQNCIPTMESVSKVRWSLENKNHIASCSLKRDYSINIWNILRPYIAYARFTEAHEITTGMAWRQGQTSLVSVTSNGNLYNLPMGCAYRPLDHANPVGMAINPDGDIALALDNGLLRASSQNQQLTIGNEQSSTSQSATSLFANSSTISQSALVSAASGSGQSSAIASKFPYQSVQSRLARQSVTRRSQDSALRPKIGSRSQLDVFKCTEMNWFVKTAQEYQLSNRPLAELCDHNAEVCAKLRRFQICQTWKILKLFYANIGSTNPGAMQSATSQVAAANQATTTSTPNRVAHQQQSHQQLVAGDDLSLSSQHQLAGSDFLMGAKNNNLQASGRGSSLQPKSIIALHESSALSALQHEFALDEASLAYSEQSNDSTDEWMSHETLSYEAFQPKHEICGRVDMVDSKLDDSHSSSDSSDHEDNYYGNNQSTNQLTNSLKTLSTAVESENDLRISHLINTKAYQFRFYEIIADVIADVLKYHVDNSDVQSAVSILIVLGDRIKNIVNERIPEMDRESWYHSYIDLLSKFQLWNVMAKVINLSPLSNINSINQTSTTIYTTCGSCQRPLNGKVGWNCERCKTKPSECSVCHGVVSGLMAWCQGCYHGGHLVHMSKWFATNDFCPTGCGHSCELSQWR